MLTEEFVTADDWSKFNSSLLIEVTRTKGVFTCTGIAVSKELIITAAHWLEGVVKKVRVFTQQSYDPKQSYLEVKSFEVHPDYNPKKSQFIADVAKIKMKEKIPADINLYPIYTSQEISGNIYRFGFGLRNKKNIRTVITPTFRQLDPELQVVQLNDMFSKSGDSGGPVYLQQNNQTYILAIHSTFSHGPQGNYSFNPLLAPYLAWIYQN